MTITDRERQVVQGLDRGLTHAEIAIELGISPRTVKAYSDRLRSKLGVAKTRQLPQALRTLEAVRAVHPGKPT